MIRVVDGAFDAALRLGYDSGVVWKQRWVQSRTDTGRFLPTPGRVHAFRAESTKLDGSSLCDNCTIDQCSEPRSGVDLSEETACITCYSIVKLTWMADANR